MAKKAMEAYQMLELSISATTRQPRVGEEPGVHYWYLSVEEFRQKIDKNDFLEYEEVYNDLYYGTLFSELDRIWEKGHVPFLDLDVKGAANLKAQYGDKGFFVFIHPGSIDELAVRLKNRGTEDEKSLTNRLRRAQFELDYAEKFDYILYNDDLKRADKEVVDIIGQYLEKHQLK